MILDNENDNLKVHEWISNYTEGGKIDIVTGYFTIGALAHLSQKVNDNIKEFRLVLGDIVNFEIEEEKPLDLLNENISIEAALHLKSLSQEVVTFLKQDKVLAKTLEPNFCHAKSYLFNPTDKDDRKKYFISGSSNLTEAGIGLKHTNNIELNIAETGNNSQYKELVAWFKALWNKPQAHKEKTIIQNDGSKKKIDFNRSIGNRGLDKTLIEKLRINFEGDPELTHEQRGKLSGINNNLVNYLIKQIDYKQNSEKLVLETKDILKRIMNPASHASLIPIYEGELKKAIDGVKALKEILK